MVQDTRTELKTSRIEALSDGIFAIAMTILILSFETILAPPVVIDEKHLAKMLHSLWPDFLHYVESFVILGAFWFQHHHQFHYIKRADFMLLSINIIGLMFIALIPFSTVMISDYGTMRSASVLFEVNLLIAGIIFFVHWVYASAGHRLIDPELSRDTIRFYMGRNLIIPAVSLGAMILSFFIPRGGTVLYFMVPLILFFWREKAKNNPQQ